MSISNEFDMSPDWPEILVAMMLGSLAIFIAALYFLKRQQTAFSEKSIASVRQEISELRQRLEKLEGMSNQRDQETQEPQEPDLSIYEYAIQYAKQGMIPVEIAARCGISQDEAALIVSLHK